MQYKPKENFITQCLNCNKDFHPLTPNQKYCCFDCRKKARKVRQKELLTMPRNKYTECLYCGRLIEKISNKKFCRERCRILYRNLKRNKNSEKCIKTIKKNVQKKYCKFCNKEIPFNSRRAYNYDNLIYCSKKCAALDRNGHIYNCDDSVVNQFKKDGFNIIVKTINDRYVWQAYKNKKIVLQSDRDFSNLNDLMKDINNAF